MRIYFCRQGLTYVCRILQQELPEDDVLDCPPDQVPEAARNADILIPTVSPIGKEALQSSRLKLVQQYGAGLDSVDIPAATAAGVYVANVPTAGTGNAESVAELALFFMLGLARKYRQTQESIQNKVLGSPMGQALKGKTVAIIGYGGIGRALARRLTGFEMRILAVSRRGPTTDKPDDGLPLTHVAQDGFHTVLREADFVITAPPLNDETRSLMGRAEFACMKPEAFVINVARGPVLDYVALLAALREGRIAGAGLDVFWHEPFDPNDEIFQYNVLATPHIGGATDVSLQGIAKRVAENVNRLRTGEMPLNCVNAGVKPKG